LKINAKAWAISLLIAAVLLMTGAIFLLRYAVLADKPKGGWYVENGVTRYLNERGSLLHGWQEIQGQTYYFLPNGVMSTGWQTIEGKQHYFEDSGRPAQGLRIVEHGGPARFFFDANGGIITGWQEVDGATYYFAEGGAALTGWHTVDGQRYYFTPEGKLLAGWQELDGKRYYLTETGHTLSGWQDLEGVRHCFGEDGAVLSGWFSDETGKYYLDERGCPSVGWQEIGSNRYYFGENGVMTTGWLTLDGDRYYFGADGSMSVGEVKIDGVSNFFTSKGKYVLLCNRWNPVPADFVLDLVATGNYQIDRSAKDSLEAMIEACRNAGFSCTINNTYRSKDLQQYLWDRSVSRYMAGGMSYEKACQETGKDTMLPGHSEHQTGLAVDLDGSDKSYAWLAEHCWEYGFILRYPADKTEKTGIIHEPWHFRYVGRELSLELQELGLCMEEYMQNLTK